MEGNDDLKVSVIGQGYVGLPLAVLAAESGYIVTGVDVNLQRVALINSGKSPIEDVTDQRISQMVKIGRFEATTNFEVIKDSQIVIICVPTPLDNQQKPDLSALKSAVNSAIPFLKEDALLINESTSFPGTLRNVIVPLVRAGYKGKKLNLSFASAPERINPGDSIWNISNTPRIIGGIDKESERKAYNFYSRICENVIVTSSPEVAESAKLLENTFRLVNIALINEFNQILSRHGIDINEVVDAASTKPYGFSPFRSGVGVGGHCIPVDPIYFSSWAEDAGMKSNLVDTANKITKSMPEFVAEKALSIARRKVNSILILGVAYKPGTADTRETPVFDLVKTLRNRGFKVAWHDPLVKYWEGEFSVELDWPCDLVILAISQPTIDISPILKAGIPILDCTNGYKNQEGVIPL